MKKRIMFFGIILSAFLGNFPITVDGICQENERIAVLLMLGLKDQQGRDWNGEVTIDRGRILALRGIEFDNNDAILSASEWECNTERVSSMRFRGRTPENPPVSAEGVMVVMEAPLSARLSVKTVNGNFTVPLNRVRYGKKDLDLRGEVSYERVPFPDLIAPPVSGKNDDFPAIAADGKGNIWMAWVSYTYEGNDQILMRKWDGSTWSEEIQVSRAGGDYFKAALAVSGEGELWIVWSENRNGNWDLMGRKYKDGDASQIISITNAPEPDIFHKMITDVHGNIWLTWQSYRYGNSDIFLKKYNGKVWEEPIPVTTDPGNDWEPVIAADSKGNVFITWDTYRNGSYDVYLAEVKSESVSRTLPIAATEDFEGYTSIACDKNDRVWIAWENGGPEWGKDRPGALGYRSGGYKTELIGKQIDASHGIDPLKKFTDIACYDRGKLEKPLVSLNSSLNESFKLNNSHPTIGCDAAGRVWIFFRTVWNMTAGRQMIWTIYGSFYEGNKWSDPILLPLSNGRNDHRMAALPYGNNGLFISYVRDGRESGPKASAREENLSVNPSDNQVVAAFIDVGATANLPQTSTASEVRVTRITPEPTRLESRFPITTGNKTYHTYWGELHRHTDISGDGGLDGSLLDVFRFALDAARMDFIMVSDHNFGRGAARSGAFTYGWWRTEKSEDLFKITGMFMPLFGYERSIPWPDGHRNVVRPERGYLDQPRFAREVVGQDGNITRELVKDDEVRLWKSLEGQNVITIPHTSGSRMGTDWNMHPSNPEFDRVIEIYQGDRNSYEHVGAPKGPTDAEEYANGMVWNAFEQGAKFGFIASSDHHSTHISWAAVYADEFTRESIFNGLKARRTYAATDKIGLEFRIGENILGEEISIKEIPKLKVHVIGTDIIKRVEIIKNNTFIYSMEPESREVSFLLRDDTITPGEHYYYVRVIQKDEAMAWGSPIWVTYR